MNLAATPRTIAAFESAAWLAQLFGSAPASRPALSGRLDASRCVHLDHPEGRRITCTDGSLWLTIDGEPEDTVLEAGESCTCTQDAPLIISAFGDAAWRAD